MKIGLFFFFSATALCIILGCHCFRTLHFKSKLFGDYRRLTFKEMGFLTEEEFLKEKIPYKNNHHSELEVKQTMNLPKITIEKNPKP